MLEEVNGLSEAGLSRSGDTTRLLVETARALGETLDRQRLYDRFQSLLAGAMPHDGVVVSSYDPQEELIRCDFAWVDGNRLDPATLPPLRPNPTGEGMQTRVIRTGEPLLENDVAKRVEQAGGTFYNVDGEGRIRKVPESGPVAVRAAIMVPVKHEGEVVGVVQVMSDRQPYTSEDVELVEALVGQMSAAVRNAKLYEELRASEARFRATFENAAVGIAHVALDGSWLRVNDRLCEIVGYPRDELLQLTFQEITHPADLEADLAQAERLRAGGIDHFSMEKRYVRKNGTVVWAIITVSLLRGEAGEPMHFISVVEDISQRKRAEAEQRRLGAAAESARAVARERAQAARVLATVADGVVLVDGEGVVRLWNEAAERMLGVPAAGILERRLEEVLPGWRTIREGVGSGEAVVTLPFVLGDSELWLSVAAVESTDGVVYAFRDETGERALEQAKSEFVATVSHELRTPLAAVYGAAQTLLRDDVDLTRDERRPLLDMIASQTERLTQIADEVLLASKIERGDVPVQAERVDVADLAEEIVRAMRARLPDGMTLALEVAEKVPPVRGDPHRIRQVLINVIDNAIKYSPEGGPVTIELTPMEWTVRTAVCDHGLGIAPYEQERIFERFYRSDPNHARTPGGTGLGLYICRELLERMGGRIGVTSEVGLGSTFFFELPRADD